MKSNSKVVRMTEAGFTLVELMIVVAIIGILAAIAIPNFQKYQAKARQKESQILLSNLYTAETSNRGEHGTFTSCLTNAGFTPEGTKRYYAIGFTAAAAATAACRVPGTPADVACNLAVTAGIGAVGAGATCTAVDGSPNTPATEATYNLALAKMTHAFSATTRAGTYEPTSANLVGTGVATATFTAGAVGNISSGAVRDTWTIDQAKAMLNTVSGL